VTDQHDAAACDRELAFPACPANRPGLSRIQRRIGTYPDIRAFLFDGINRADPLDRWTHRQPDDPGIALLEGTAIVGDILTFYQELYANEVYLRTAAWRESVAALVRLLGYRLSPGVGGRGAFAIEVKGRPVTVPAGFPLTAQVTGMEPPADFQTREPLVAYPWLSRFELCRPLAVPVIDTQTRELVISTGPADLDLQRGQRLIVGAGGTDIDWANAEIAVVDSVRQRLGETLVTIRGELRNVVPTQGLVAYRIGRSFRHFGHNAPPQATIIDASNQPKTSWVSYTRYLGATTSASSGGNPMLTSVEMPLDQSVPDLPSGTTVIVQVTPPPSRLLVRDIEVYKAGGGTPERAVAYRQPLEATWISTIGGGSSTATVSSGGGGGGTSQDSAGASGGGQIGSEIGSFGGVDVSAITDLAAELNVPVAGTVDIAQVETRFHVDIARTVVRTVEGVRQSSLSWGSLTGPSTVLTLDDSISSDKTDYASIRNLQIHEVTSTHLRLAAAEVPTTDTRGPNVGFVGTEEEAAALEGRQIMLVPDSRRPTTATVLRLEPSGLPPDARRLRPIVLDSVVDYAAFGPEGSSVVVHGNVVEATQGKAEQEEPIGSGDARTPFQTMPLPKKPLTYLTTPGNTPPETPELDVFVDGRRWRRVASLFGSGRTDPVYVVREDDDGQSWIGFGDGKTGARLPSGVNNVVVRYRSGVAAFGPLRPDTSVQAGARLDRLDKIGLPGEVTGGDEPEDAASAREAAPGTVQGLDRLVSLRDFETETLAIAGVARVRAAWRLVDNVPAAVVTILMATGRDAEIDQVRGIVAASDRRRGAGRFPVIVIGGRRRGFRVLLQVALDGTIREAEVLAAIRRTLRVGGIDDAEDGTGDRGFGEREHATRIEGRVQRIEGVRWARVDSIDAELLLQRVVERRSFRPGALEIRAPAAAAIVEGRVGGLALLAGRLRRVEAVDTMIRRPIEDLLGPRRLDIAERFGRRQPTRVAVPGPDEILSLQSADLAITVVAAPAGEANQ
jgi:hypothetical protein